MLTRPFKAVPLENRRRKLSGQPWTCYLTKSGAYSFVWTASGSTACFDHVDTKGMVDLTVGWPCDQ